MLKGLSVAALLASAGTASAAGLPQTMIWSAYDLGSSGYVEASAIADALGKQYNVRVRLQPSGTSIGRLLPLREKRVGYGWLGNEVYFATQATYDFAAKSWGPQDLRVVLGRPGTFGLAVTKTSGIKSADDLKGKRIAWVTANPSVNLKVEGVLAFAHLDWKDVERVTFPSYGASLKGLLEGKADAAGTVPTAATLREVESSPVGLGWVDMPPGNTQGWEKLQDAVPFLAPAEETIGAGIEAGKPIHLMGYKYPMITVYADASEDEVYEFTKAVASTFDLYKDAAPVMKRWDVKEAGLPPIDAPFHPGAIRYLKEVGVWGAQQDAWNKKALDQMAAVKKAWGEALAKAKAENVSDEAFPEFWLKYRETALAKK